MPEEEKSLAPDVLLAHDCRILVVEDAKDMSDLLEQALRESGYSVTVAHNGAEALPLASKQDLLIVDVMMPVMNGFDLVTKLRQAGNRAPVIFLTAKNAPGDLVHGLDLGADDYIVKPFKLAELLARVRALVRRSRESMDELRYGNVYMDIRNRKVRRGEHWLPLSNTEFNLLKTLMTHPGEPVSKQSIMLEVWDDADYGSENIVEVYINYLRSKMETHDQPRLIHTVRGKGYVLEDRGP